MIYGGAALGIRERKALPITDEHPIPHPAKHRFLNGKQALIGEKGVVNGISEEKYERKNRSR